MKPTTEGFFKVLWGSVILHIIIIALGAYIFSAPSRKIFTPVYTVDLVASGPKAKTKKRRKAPIAKAPAKVKKKAAPAKVKKKAAPVRVKKKARATKKAAVKKKAPKETVKIKQKAPAKEKVSVSASIDEIAKKKEREQETELLSSRIEELKRQQEAKSEDVARRLEEIKRRIASSSVAAAPGAPATEDAQGGGETPGPGARRIGFAGRSGVTSENLQTKYREYYNIIQSRVHENWIYPKGFAYEKVTVIVSIRIDRDGNLISSWLEESSGHRRFDDSLLSATRKAAPFPPLPVDFEENFLEVGLRFCPDCTD